jgi:hypothetical protein
LALFSLDIFDMHLGFWETLAGLFMHNIPVIILALVLFLSWKYEIVGGISFILVGVVYIVLILLNNYGNQFEWYALSYSLIIAGPALVIGILFLINWKRKER